MIQHHRRMDVPNTALSLWWDSGVFFSVLCAIHDRNNLVLIRIRCILRSISGLFKAKSRVLEVA